MSHEKRYVKYVTFKTFKPGDSLITMKINSSYKSADRSRKGEVSIKSARTSLKRAHKNLFEVLRSNDWTYFLTLTFGFDGLGADDLCRCAFSKWEKDIRQRFPSMYYVAVPEYHKKGDLHYHLVVGGVSSDDLQLVDSKRVLHKGKAWRKCDFVRRGFQYDESTGEGMPIYNVNAWDNGFSTATEVRNTEAVAYYVGKYLTKVDIDPRFYNKRRFHTSHNIRRPSVLRYVEDDLSIPSFDLADDEYIDTFGMPKEYESPSLRFRQYSPVRIIR